MDKLQSSFPWLVMLIICCFICSFLRMIKMFVIVLSRMNVQKYNTAFHVMQTVYHWRHVRKFSRWYWHLLYENKGKLIRKMALFLPGRVFHRKPIELEQVCWFVVFFFSPTGSSQEKAESRKMLSRWKTLCHIYLFALFHTIVEG